MTLDELELLVMRATDPREIFGDDVEGNLRRLRSVCEAYEGTKKEGRRAQAVIDALERFARFTPDDVRALAHAEAVFRSSTDDGRPAWKAAPSYTSPSRDYFVSSRLGVGDVSDVYLARGEGGDYVLKVARVREAGSLLEVEWEGLGAVLASVVGTSYLDYFPARVEAFTVVDGFSRRVNVFRHGPGYFNLEQVHRRHPALDGRHLAWIFNRLLTALGCVHRAGRVHGAIVPEHVLVHAEGHGLRLVGWGHSVATGGRILNGPASRLDWYPPEVRRRQGAVAATDLYLAARCVAYLAGGDPVSGRLPETLPRPIAGILRSCMLEGPRMRPDDAWDLLDEFQARLGEVYGPPNYHFLDMG